MEVTNAASVTIQVHLITESTVLSNLLQWPLKTNKETSDIKTQPYGISFTKSACDLSALKSASYSLRDLTFLPALGRKGWWMSRVRQALYGEWVNRLSWCISGTTLWSTSFAPTTETTQQCVKKTSAVGHCAQGAWRVGWTETAVFTVFRLN